jgi:hypothetical protein
VVDHQSATVASGGARGAFVASAVLETLIPAAGCVHGVEESTQWERNQGSQATGVLPASALSWVVGWRVDDAGVGASTAPVAAAKSTVEETWFAGTVAGVGVAVVAFVAYVAVQTGLLAPCGFGGAVHPGAIIPGSV